MGAENQQETRRASVEDPQRPYAGLLLFTEKKRWSDLCGDAEG